MKTEKNLLILFGSQTGTAEEYAENIWRQSRIRGFSGPVKAMDDYNIEGLVREEFVVFVCSTTGLGEEPDNMKKFWKFLLRKSLPANSLSNLKFCVLGLGDSSYSKYNYPAKKLSKRLLQLGGQQLQDVGLCNYQHDLGHDAVAEPWSVNLWTQLGNFFVIEPITKENTWSSLIPRWNVQCTSNVKSECNLDYLKDLRFSNSDNLDEYPDKPFMISLESNERTTAESHFQDVRLLKFSRVNGSLDYDPGDVLNFRPRNSKEKVERFFAAFKNHSLHLNPDDIIELSQIDEGKYNDLWKNSLT